MTIDKHRLYIVIPVFNRKDLLSECLASFYKQTYKNFQIIVVDDGSTDGTSEMIKLKFPEVIVLRGDGNLWWTGSINKGIKYALTKTSNEDFILVINDDLEVNEDYLETLINLASKNKDTLIGSVVVDIKNQDIIHTGGELVNPLTAKRKLINKGKKLSDFDKNTIYEVSRLTGRGTLIPVNVFQEIGLYDDKHFKQCGDLELPARAMKNGYRLIVSYSSIVKSHIDQTYDLNSINKYYIKDIKKHFFDIKSNHNLKYLFYNSWNAAKNPFYFISFFLFALIRSLVRYILKLRF